MTAEFVADARRWKERSDLLDEVKAQRDLASEQRAALLADVARYEGALDALNGRVADLTAENGARIEEAARAREAAASRPGWWSVLIGVGSGLALGLVGGLLLD